MSFFKGFSKKELTILIILSVIVLVSITGDVIAYSVAFSSESEVEADKESEVESVADSYVEQTTEAPTEPTTEATTEAPTEPVTEPPTEAPTEQVTEPPTEAVVQPVYYGELIELPQAEWETEIVNVMLDVPDYKQYDSRWCDKYISTKTIGTVGCLVTSVSQVYSYNNGVTVYPDGMLSMVGFSGNLLEWYTVPNVGLKYTHQFKANINLKIMNNIYKRLKESRPVIVGGTNNSGGMHWVVVKGYNVNATGTMTPADFVINDPGGTKRINLADFLLEYPSVERLVY